MEAKAARFDPASERFLEHYNTVRGYVRQEVTRQNLVSHLPSGGALNVLDFGAGDGRDALWFAGMGDTVTLVDESLEMTKKANELISDSDIKIRRHVDRIITGNAHHLEKDDQYDVIVSHGVLMYELDDPTGQLQALAAHIKPKGILSLLTKGKEAARQQVEGSEAIAKFEDSGEYVNRRGLPARAYSFNRLDGMIRQAGLEPIAHYGVRVMFDDDQRALEEISEADRNLIIHQELEASRDAQRMEQAQMLHVIARKAS